MFLSIILPVLNEKQALQQLFASHVFPQEVEIIIVDGGSTDNSLIELPDRVTMVQSEAGRARQMNRGAESATGDMLLFLHVDSVLPDDWLNQLTRFWMSEADWGRFDIKLSGEHVLFRLIEFMMNRRSRMTSIVTGDQGLFVRAATFHQVGGFPNLPLMEDVEMSKLLKRRSSPFNVGSQLTTSSRRWEKNGIIRTILLMWSLRLLHFFGVPAARLARLYQ